ncbi:ABC transporter ATP-binding protein [Leisingera sp.]|uniref:ABC transporter ATP-binding protein n=1 Tax=Leisingera sp. TaxID=1879318 RepID=UPI002B26C110|nr:ABC transporter ATP-binding protein [Leisingera sp.]
MIKLLTRLLGADGAVLRRYGLLALACGVLNALTIALTVPVMQHALRGDLAAAAVWIGALMPAALCCWLLRRRVETAGIDVGIAVLRGVRLRLGRHVARLPAGWFDTGSAGRLAHALTDGVMEVAQLPAHVFTPVLTGLAVPPVLILVLLLLDWQTGSLAALALPVLIGAGGLAGRLGRKAGEGFHAAAAETSQRAVEFARSQAILRAFNASGAQFLDAAFDRQRRSSRQLIRLSTLSVMMNSWVIQGVFAGAILMATLRYVDGLPPERAVALVVALVLVMRFLEPVTELAGFAAALRAARAQLITLTEILDACPLPVPAQPRQPKDASVTLENVYFSYHPTADAVLKDLSLQVPQGSMTAVIGASGSGKSTLLRLVARFHDPDGGAIRIGGLDLREMSEQTLSELISQVFQDTYLLPGTIADNIRMGRPDATAEELDEVVRLAGVDHIVTRLPEGMDSQVGDGGVRLSGGERQRIAIARALLKDAPILLVDEATSALDAENQAIVTRALAQLRGRRTLIVVAHRIATLDMADQVAVLEGGRVVECGRPADLAARGGPYAAAIARDRSARCWRIGGQV